MKKEWITQDWTTGDLNALVKNLGGEEIARKIQRGEVKINIEEIIEKFFDKHGRRIPKDLKNSVRDPNRDFYLNQPKLETIDDYGERYTRFAEAFHPGPIISVAEFQAKSQKLIKQIKADENLKNLLNGVYLPIIILELESKKFDYGQILEKVFLSAVEKAYQKQFPSRNFYNYRKNELKGKVSIVENSRHNQLIKEMKKGPVVAVYFPNPLQGFSILAAREQVKTLPENLFLSGGFDIATAMTIYPDVLARDCSTSGYDLSALSWKSPNYSFYFEVSGDELHFDRYGHLSHAIDDYSSGLLFLG